jgi:hypothetical protein
MRETKNDLCADEAKLDLQALITTAEAACGLLVEQICKKTDKMREALRRKDLHNNTSLHLEAEWLCDDAKFLVIAAETCATLREAVTRHDITIVNRPIIIKKEECDA